MGDRSVDARDISRVVVVTGDGNTVALTLGDTGIRLPLRRKQFPPPERRRRRRDGEPPRELDLLVPVQDFTYTVEDADLTFFARLRGLF